MLFTYKMALWQYYNTISSSISDSITKNAPELPSSRLSQKVISIFRKFKVKWYMGSRTFCDFWTRSCCCRTHVATASSQSTPTDESSGQHEPLPPYSPRCVGGSQKLDPLPPAWLRNFTPHSQGYPDAGPHPPQAQQPVENKNSLGFLSRSTAIPE